MSRRFVLTGLPTILFSIGGLWGLTEFMQVWPLHCMCDGKQVPRSHHRHVHVSRRRQGKRQVAAARKGTRTMSQRQFDIEEEYKAGVEGRGERERRIEGEREIALRSIALSSALCCPLTPRLPNATGQETLAKLEDNYDIVRVPRPAQSAEE